MKDLLNINCQIVKTYPLQIIVTSRTGKIVYVSHGFSLRFYARFIRALSKCTYFVSKKTFKTAIAYPKIIACILPLGNGRLKLSRPIYWLIQAQYSAVACRIHLSIFRYSFSSTK